MDTLRDVWRRLRRHRPAVAGLLFLGLLILVASFAPQLAPHGFAESDLTNTLKPASWHFLLGTDEQGRDVFSRIIYGSRLSLQVAVVAGALGVSVGVVLGAWAGYAGGAVETVLMRGMDVMLAFPSTLLAISFVVLLGPGLTKAMIAIGIVSIPAYARVTRGAVLSVKENEYVLAARATGAGTVRIIGRHVLPQVFAPILVRATLGTSEAILDAAALGFLGLGAQLPQPEWGAMLSRGFRYLNTAPTLTFFPGLAITLTVLALNLLGDGLRDALDPRLK